MEIKPIKSFNKTITVAPDKSITHRAIMFNALGKGKAIITNALVGEDCLSTIKCMRKLGAKITRRGDRITVTGADGKFNDAKLHVGNSGTTFRLMCGILASRKGKFTITGDGSIRRRPMARVIDPLKAMGAEIKSKGGFAPVKIEGSELEGVEYEMPVASAQVKSAILLAGVNANGKTVVTEKEISRNHTEIMLKAMGAKIEVDGKTVTVEKSDLKCVDIVVPGDVSSAAYPFVLASCKKGAKVTVKGVGINPTRVGILTVMEKCGAKITYEKVEQSAEPIADVTVEYSEMKPFTITKEIMPYLIDEIPVIAVMACFIKGESVIAGAEELKVKESNRIDTTVNALKAMGADIRATEDGMIIRGSGFLKGGAVIDSCGDHRIAMSMSIAGALSEEGVTVLNPQCVAISYPNFYQLFEE